MPELPKYGPLPDSHCVPDVLTPNLRVVFCGTALGRLSAREKAYYAHPGNFFWRTLHAIGLTPRLLSPSEYTRVRAHGIGLTDLCKRHFGNDAELPGDAFDTTALREKILHYQPRILAFTSKTGAAAFLGKPTAQIPLGPQKEQVGDTAIWVLSSPSGQARIFWRQDIWQALADDVLAKQ